MRTRTTTAAVTACLLATLAACSSKEPAAKATPSSDTLASARAAAGLPAEPDTKTRQAYLDALTAIDPRIIKPGKEDQAESRGINQCSSLKTIKDESKLATLALERFTVTTRLPDIATPDTGKAIVKAVHTHLCPSF